MKHIYILSIIVLLFSCAGTNKRNKTNDFSNISMVDLLSNSAKYDKKKVKITGYFIIQKEESVIYLSESDFENGVFKNGVWLSVSKEHLTEQNIKPPYKGYISIQGVFIKDKKKSKSLFNGTLTDINYVDRMYKRNSIDEYNID